jgi:chemotaxis protein histidine kinase CheA
VHDFGQQLAPISFTHPANLPVAPACRAGQGGRQSAKDAGGKYAKSAGSRLRRYNEAALQRDVAEALGSWQELLAGCALIFVHAPSSNWQQLFGGEQPLLGKADPRVRRVPFTTRRPTFSETKRVMRILVTLYQQPALPTLEQQQQQQQQQQQALLPLEGAALQQQQQQVAQAQQAATEQEAAAAAAAAAVEEETRRKKAEKKARQKAKQKEQRQAESAAEQAAAKEAAALAADDEIGRAAAAVAAMSDKLTSKPAIVGGGRGSGKASGGSVPPRLSAKPRANEGPDVRRARMAAAAEARMAALQAAAKQQQLH